MCLVPLLMSDSLWPYGCSLPGSFVHGIFQAGILEWVAVPSSRESSLPGIKPTPLMSTALAGGFFTTSVLLTMVKFKWEEKRKTGCLSRILVRKKKKKNFSENDIIRCQSESHWMHSGGWITEVWMHEETPERIFWKRVFWFFPAMEQDSGAYFQAWPLK